MLLDFILHTRYAEPTHNLMNKFTTTIEIVFVLFYLLQPYILLQRCIQSLFVQSDLSLIDTWKKFYFLCQYYSQYHQLLLPHILITMIYLANTSRDESQTNDHRDSEPKGVVHRVQSPTLSLPIHKYPTAVLINGITCSRDL